MEVVFEEATAESCLGGPTWENALVPLVAFEIVVEMVAAGAMLFDQKIGVVDRVIGEGHHGLAPFVKDFENLFQERGVEVGSPEGGVLERVLDDRAGVAHQRGVETQHFGDRPGLAVPPTCAEDQLHAGVFGVAERLDGAVTERAITVKECAVDIEREEPILGVVEASRFNDPPPESSCNGGMNAMILTERPALAQGSVLLFREDCKILVLDKQS